MEIVTLDNGVTLPALGLGVLQTPPDEIREAVTAALASGYRHVDIGTRPQNRSSPNSAAAHAIHK